MPTLIAMMCLYASCVFVEKFCGSNCWGSELADFFGHVVGREAEMREQVRRLAGSTEAIDAEHAARGADVAPPALARRRLYCETLRDGRRQHRIAVRLILRLERFGRRHRHEAHLAAFRIERVHRFDGETDF